MECCCENKCVLLNYTALGGMTGWYECLEWVSQQACRKFKSTSYIYKTAVFYDAIKCFISFHRNISQGHMWRVNSNNGLANTYLLTYSMVQSPSWEANWFAASQEIPRISRNPKVRYPTHKRPPPVSILGQPNPVHIPTSHLLEIYPNIIHPSTPRSPQWSLSLRFPQQDPITPSPHPYAPHAQPISLFSILSLAQYWVRSTDHLAPRCAISSIPPLTVSLIYAKFKIILYVLNEMKSRNNKGKSPEW